LGRFQGCNCRGCLSYVITIPSSAILILFLILDENSEREISELAERLERAHPGCIFGRYPVPTPTTMDEWFHQFETDFEKCNIPLHLRHYTVCLVLPAFIQKALFDSKHGWERLLWIMFEFVLTRIVRRHENLGNHLFGSGYNSRN